jgi:NAD(P)-dependent dehydrogenase (short-subunit alcohol dehydrogenase family)
LHRAPGAIFSPDGTHVVIGGTGGLGRSIVKYMVEHGARHILLLSRSGDAKGVLEPLCIDMREQYDAIITPIKCDVGDENQVWSLVEFCESALPPIRGVIHAAMVLRVSAGALVGD